MENQRLSHSPLSQLVLFQRTAELYYDLFVIEKII